MKKILLLLLVLSLQSCINLFGGEPVEPPIQESKYAAVFMDRTEFENSVVLQNSNTIMDAGKIYTYNDNLFINEKNEGFHICNNSDPQNPVIIRFINSPGATDLAIKNDVIYINQATDLIAVTISDDLESLTVTKRIRNVFPEMLSPDGFYKYTPEGKVLIKWTPLN